MRLRPGQTAQQAIRQLNDLAERGARFEGATGQPLLVQNDYLVWTENAEMVLARFFVEPDLASELRTTRYWHIRTMPNMPVRPYPLIGAEAAFQTAKLLETADRLAEFVKLAGQPGAVLLLDTNTFMHCTQFPDVDWRTEFNEDMVRLVVPLIVLDELDDKTFSGNSRLAKRADKVLRQFDRFMEAIVRDGFATVREKVTIEVLADEDGHRRRGNNDTELLDRAEFLQQVIEQPVTIVTTDRGMRVRAGARDIVVKPMPEYLRLPLSEDPPALAVENGRPTTRSK
jgi:hypothetical protein